LLEQVYLILIVILFVLAISDLIVGVSNDAVNFLNSAIGSKVASRWIIMLVASLGIILGATFSSGIMEVARKGVFFPDQFLFADVMIIFIAVMLTDIILLDLFNTFALPTSTTVSIVFELLGASFIVAFLKMLDSDGNINTIGNYINIDSALTIIGGIFISIFIAFITGMVVQYISRFLFTFQYQKRMRVVGVLWSSLALTAISYFLILKGVKGASFVSASSIEWFEKNTLLISSISFGVGVVIFYVLYDTLKVNILKIVVLFGTFALAMAFAGNDLVNFIGVPIAGLTSFTHWQSSGLEATAYHMSILNAPIKTDTYLLLLAAAVMVLTLWFSKKAKSVTDTEVNLGRQDSESERFKSNALSRGIVQGAIEISKSVKSTMPNEWLVKIERNFKNTNNLHDNDTPAFDLVRASVNLTMASILIAMATSLKLPLSTTYVSFMVAMGTSLSDRAWGRDSAVYRVSGVVNVILGWLGTALIAFLVSGSFAFLIYYFGLWMVAVLATLAIVIITKTFLYHKNSERKKALTVSILSETSLIPADKAMAEINKRTQNNLLRIKDLFAQTIEGLIIEKKKPLKKSLKALEVIAENSEVFKVNLIKFINRIDENGGDISKVYLSIYDQEQDMVQSVQLIVNSCFDHVKNMHLPLTKDQRDGLNALNHDMQEYLSQAVALLQQTSHKQMKDYVKCKRKLLDRILELIDFQIRSVRKKDKNKRTDTLFFNLLLECKDMVTTTNRFINIFTKKSNFPRQNLMSAKLK